jgi:hypothetical protein
MGEMRNIYNNLVANSERKRLPEIPRRRWNMLEWMLGKQGEKMGTGIIWFSIGTSGGLL